MRSNISEENSTYLFFLSAYSSLFFYKRALIFVGKKSGLSELMTYASKASKHTLKRNYLLMVLPG